MLFKSWNNGQTDGTKINVYKKGREGSAQIKHHVSDTEAELMAGTCMALNGTSSLVLIDEAADGYRKINSGICKSILCSHLKTTDNLKHTIPPM